MNRGRKDVTFAAGDIVKFNVQGKTGNAKKLGPAYKGPYKVLGMRSNVTVRIENVQTGEHDTVHVSKLSPMAVAKDDEPRIPQSTFVGMIQVGDSLEFRGQFCRRHGRCPRPLVDATWE